LPTYEFECPECEYRFEQRRSFSDEGSVSCPKCHCETRKVFSPVPIIFKGSGFYVTDHRGNNSGSAPPESGSAPASSVKSSDTSKPAEAAKTKTANTKAD